MRAPPTPRCSGSRSMPRPRRDGSALSSVHRRELRRRPGRRRDHRGGARRPARRHRGSDRALPDPAGLRAAHAARPHADRPRLRHLGLKPLRHARGAARSARAKTMRRHDGSRRRRHDRARSAARRRRAVDGAYRFPVRVYYEDTDAAGHRLLRQLPQIRRARAHRDAAPPRRRARTACAREQRHRLRGAALRRRLSRAGAARR